jgi:hypothetical protein
MANWLVIKDNYVIGGVTWDGVTPYSYPYPHDYMIEDKDIIANIGDWYETSEKIFYRPLTIPPDFPGIP